MPSIAAERSLRRPGRAAAEGHAGRARCLRTCATPSAAALDEYAVTPPSRGHVELREAIARTPAGARRPGARDPRHERRHARARASRSARCSKPGDEGDRPDAVLLLPGGLIERAGGVFVPVAGREEDLAVGSRGDRAGGDAEVARARPDESEQPRRAYLPAREKIDELLAVASRHNLIVITDEAYERCIHEGELASAWGRRERDPDPEPRQEPRDAGVATRLRRRRAVRHRGVPPRARVGRHPHQPCRAAGRHCRARRPAGLAGRRRRALPPRPRRRPRRRSPTTRSCRPPLPPAGPFLFVDLGGLHIENLLAAGVPVVDGAAFGAPGYARLPFGGAADLAEELHRRLALATS